MTIREVIELTRAKNISGVPVVVGAKAVGIVTHRDLRFETKLDAPVSTVMTPQGPLDHGARERAEGRSARAAAQAPHREGAGGRRRTSSCKGMITVKDFQKAHGVSAMPARTSAAPARRRGRRVRRRHRCERVAALREAGVDVIVVDTSHGHSQRRDRDACAEIKRKFRDMQVIGGNIVTADAAHGAGRSRRRRRSRSASVRARSARRASSPASACRRSPRSRTVAEALEGTGVPAHRRRRHPLSRATSPRRSSAGAHCVMIGGMFAGTEESPGEVELYQGRSYKAYRGMGSLGAMAQAHGSKDRYFQDATDGAREARAGRHRGPRAVQGHAGHHPAPACRAACAPPWATPAAARIEEMRTRPQFVRITSAGVRESHVHDVTITKEAPNYRVELSYGARVRAERAVLRVTQPRLRRH